MEIEDIERTAHAAYEAIFQDNDSVEIDGDTYPIELTSRSRLRKVSVEDHLFIEQNPNKDSGGKAATRGSPDHVGDEG